jgi:hypothetical protein
MNVVLNSSPLIFLAKLGYLNQFVKSSDNFYIRLQRGRIHCVAADRREVICGNHRLFGGSMPLDRFTCRKGDRLEIIC